MSTCYAKAPKVLLPKNHLSFQLLPSLKETCRTFFQKTGVQHFHYLHYDLNNETVAAITTAPLANSYVLETQALATGAELETGIHYLPLFRAGTERAEAGKRFNVDQILEFIDNKGDGTVEMFGFATKIGQPEMVNFYFNNLNFLKQFTLEFKDQARDMLKKALADPIAVPGHNKIINQPRIADQSKRILQIGQRKISISKREHEVLSAISAGLTAKQSAEILAISYRTVEFYIENIKNKLGCNNKTELIKFFIKNIETK